jgi:A/G-specific adenine glycosylase
MPIGRAWDWNQAMMDLGATVCTARAPSCYRCPVNEMCASRASLSPRSTMPPPRAAEARAPYRASEQYSGSSRFFRGRIVQRLRELGPNETLSLDELGGAVRDDYSAAQRGWLLGLVQGLDADGLLKVHRQGDPAEELAGSIRVGLP